MNMRREPDEFSRALVSEALDAVRADDEATLVPPRVQHRVMGEWDAQAMRRRRHWLAPAVAAAIAASLTAAIVWSRASGTPFRPSSLDGGTVASAAAAADLLFTEVALEGDPASMQYVQVRLPQSALAEHGLPIADPADHQAVVVEVLVGLDGVPRAMRLLPKEAQ